MIEIDEMLLKGMPEKAIEKLKKVPGKQGFRYITKKINIEQIEDEKTR